jgi:hypothetical protein
MTAGLYFFKMSINISQNDVLVLNWLRQAKLESGCSTLGGGGGGGSPSDMVGWSKYYRNTHEPRGSPVPGFVTQDAHTLRVTNMETGSIIWNP